MSNSLRPHGLQHTRLPCPSLSPGVCSNSCPLSWVMVSNHLILCHSFLLLPSIFPSTRVSPNKSTLCISVAMYWSFSLSNEYSGLISIRINWFDLPEVQGTLKSLLQHHNSKAPILQCSAFFMVQLTSVQDYWKNHSFDHTDLCWQSDVSAF